LGFERIDLGDGGLGREVDLKADVGLGHVEVEAPPAPQADRLNPHPRFIFTSHLLDRASHQRAPSVSSRRRMG
jgi:hypothetical protein